MRRGGREGAASAAPFFSPPGDELRGYIPGDARRKTRRDAR